MFLWAALAALLVLVVTRGVATHTSAGGPGDHRFSHIYPPDPFAFERPPVGAASPFVPLLDRIHTGAEISNISALSAALPSHGLVQFGATVWRLTTPLEIGPRTTLALNGPLRLELAPGAYLLAQRGAHLRLHGITVVGVNRHGTEVTTPYRGRGFIDVRSGATAELTNDRFADLGYLGDQTYGVTFDGASNTSLMANCRIEHDYFGIYLGRLSGGSVTNSSFIDSVIYGIDPHTYDSHLKIINNYVRGSGVHGIIIADHVSQTTVSDNSVIGSRDHGIMVIESSDHNVITNNLVRGVFDGIVIANSSYNSVRHNDVASATRFGLRISGLATHNVISRNHFVGAIVGAFLYQGATANELTHNTFRDNYENIRVRNDAPSNIVRPVPPNSELHS